MPPELAGLEAPPRPVSLGLYGRLLFGRVAVVAAGIFAFGMTFVLAAGKLHGIILLPIVALLILLGAIQYGRRKVQLFRDGLPALATMAACITSGEDSVEMPVGQYKRQMLSIAFPGMQTVLVFAQAFRMVWLIGMIGIFIFGVVFLVFGTIFLGIMAAKDPEAVPMLFGVFGFGAIWLTMGWFMLRTGGAGIFTRSVPDALPTQCVFEFEVPSRETVRVTGTALVHLRENDEPPQPVLFDPNEPKRAALLSELDANATVSGAGGWETTGSLLTLVRVTAVAVLVVGPLVVWALRP